MQNSGYDNWEVIFVDENRVAVDKERYSHINVTESLELKNLQQCQAL